MPSQPEILGPDVLDQLHDIIVQHDPNPVVIAVVCGSPDRGLALSMWTSFEGETAQLEAQSILLHSMTAPER